MRIFSIFERLHEIEEESSASVGADEEFLSEGGDTDDGEGHVGAPEGSDEDGDSGGDSEGDESGDDSEGDKEEEQDEEQDTDEDETPPPEDSAPPQRPPIAELKKAFPDLFKKFPSLRDMYFREKEFTELFPTVSDAKEAAENTVAFINLRDDIMTGDGTKLISAIKEVGADELTKFAQNVLPALYKADPAAHWKAATPLMQNIVRSFYNEGTKRKSDDLKHAAEHLSLFLFDDVDIASGKKSVVEQPKVSPEAEKLNKERSEYEAGKYRDALNSASEEVDKGLKGIVFAKNKDGDLIMDKDGVLSKFIRDTISEKVMKEVGEQLSADKSHVAYMAKLWADAKKGNYTGDWKSRIVSAYLARAKPLVATIRTRLVAEALGTSVRDGERRVKKLKENGSRREPGTSGRASRSNNNGHVDPSKVDWDATSDEDLLNDKVTYRK